MLTDLTNNLIIFNTVLCTYSNLVQLIKVYAYMKKSLNWYGWKKKQKFAPSQRRKSDGSLRTKHKFQGNLYTKLANTNGKSLFSEQVDNWLTASYKRIKYSTNNVAHPTNMNNTLTSAVAAATSDTKRVEVVATANSFISDSWFLIIDASVLKNFIKCVGFCPTSQNTNITVNIDQTKKNCLSLLITLLRTVCKWATNYYASRKVKNNSKVKSFHKVNVRAVMVMRQFGHGLH